MDNSVPDNVILTAYFVSTPCRFKDIATCADYAAALDQSDEAVYSFFPKALATLSSTDLSLTNWLNLAIKAREVN